MPKRFFARSTNSLPKEAPISAVAIIFPSRMMGGDGENAKRFPAGFNSDDRLARFESLQHGFAPPGDVIAKIFGE